MRRSPITRWIGLSLGLCVLLVAGAILSIPSIARFTSEMPAEWNFTTEKCYVEARYAAHLAQGAGYSANAYELSEVAPPIVPGAFLAWLSRILRWDTAWLDWVLAHAFIGLTGALFYRLSADAKIPPLAALTAALIVMESGFVWSQPCSSPHMSIVIILGALVLLQRGYFRWGGVLAGVAVGAGLENLALIALAAAWVENPSAQRRFLSGTLIPFIGLILLVLTGIIPARPLILFEDGSPLDHLIPILEKTPLLLVYGVLAAFGAATLRNQDRPFIRLLAGWGVLSLLITWVLLGVPAYLPIWVGISALIGLALAQMLRRELWARLVFGAGIMGLILIPLDSPSIYVGDHYPPIGIGSVVVRAEGRFGSPLIGRPAYGRPDYGFDRPFTDLSGRLDLEIGAALQRGDMNLGVIRDLPEYLLLRDEDVTALHQASWFQRGYAVTDYGYKYKVYERITPSRGDFSATRLADLTAGEGLRLTGYAVDQSSLMPGSPFRVRLDWESEAILAPFQIETTLIQPPDITFANGTLDLLSARWRGGAFSTYHWLFPEERPYAPGMIPLLVTVKYNDGRTVSGVIGSLKVKPPFVSLPVQPLALRLGEAIRLQGAALEQNPDALRVQSLWSTDAPVVEDYAVLLHFVPVGEDTPILTGDGQPLYPTHVWEPGEVLEDKRLIPLADIPTGRYEVRIGLYGTDGTRLRFEDGRDYYLVGTVEIPPPGN